MVGMRNWLLLNSLFWLLDLTILVLVVNATDLCNMIREEKQSLQIQAFYQEPNSLEIVVMANDHLYHIPHKNVNKSTDRISLINPLTNQPIQGHKLPKPASFHIRYKNIITLPNYDYIDHSLMWDSEKQQYWHKFKLSNSTNDEEEVLNTSTLYPFNLDPMKIIHSPFTAVLTRVFQSKRNKIIQFGYVFFRLNTSKHANMILFTDYNSWFQDSRNSRKLISNVYNESNVNLSKYHEPPMYYMTISESQNTFTVGMYSHNTVVTVNDDNRLFTDWPFGFIRIGKKKLRVYLIDKDKVLIFKYIFLPSVLKTITKILKQLSLEEFFDCEDVSTTTTPPFTDQQWIIVNVVVCAVVTSVLIAVVLLAWHCCFRKRAIEVRSFKNNHSTLNYYTPPTPRQQLSSSHSETLSDTDFQRKRNFKKSKHKPSNYCASSY